MTEAEKRAKDEADRKAAQERDEAARKPPAPEKDPADAGADGPAAALSASDFLDRLQKSGTGEAKLGPAKAFVAKHPDAGIMTVLDLVAASGAPPATMEKAYGIAGLPYHAPRGAEASSRPHFPVRCPPGGCSVRGRHFQAGEVVPDDLLNDATADEVRLLCSAGTGIQARKVEQPKR